MAKTACSKRGGYVHKSAQESKNAQTCKNQHATLRRALLASASVMLACGLCGCSLPVVGTITTTTVQQAQDQKIKSLTPKVDDKALIEPGTLTVGLTSSSKVLPYFSQIDEKTNRGIDIEYACALANHLGLQVKFVHVPSTQALGKQCDIVMNAEQQKSSEQSGEAAISVLGQYTAGATGFFAKTQQKSDTQQPSTGAQQPPADTQKSDEKTAQSTTPSATEDAAAPTGIAKASNIAGKKVGVQADSATKNLLGSSSLQVEQKEFADIESIFKALADGSIDYALCDVRPGFVLARKHKTISFAGTLDTPQHRGVAVLSSNEALKAALDTAVSTVSNNGILGYITHYWLGADMALSEKTKVEGISFADTSTTPSSSAKPSNIPSLQTGNNGAVTIPSSGDGSTAGSNAAKIK